MNTIVGSGAVMLHLPWLAALAVLKQFLTQPDQALKYSLLLLGGQLFPNPLW
jgi:hypothetical protein